MTLTTAAPTDALRVIDLGRSGLLWVLELAERMKETPTAFDQALRGQAVGCWFAKPSTRTRVSMEAACWRLGALPVMLRPDELQLGRGEPIEDTARVLSSYCAAIAVRTFAQRDLELLAAAADVPVINLLTDDHHPCQALADLLTLQERFGRLEGLRLAYVGDGNNVAHSLLEAGALAGMQVSVAAPPGYWPDAAIVEHAATIADRTGGSVEVVTDPGEAVSRAHAVYTDVWVSMGQDADGERRRGELAAFRVDARLMERARAEAIFLHCLPAHRGEEVTHDVIDGPASAVWQQAGNRLPTEQALLYALVTGAWARSA
jgi:ornithine carbamoyltransferase